MKSSARWTTALAAAACLALPAAGWTQTPPASQSPTTQQPPSTQKQPSTTGQSDEAQEHLRQAQAALKDVPATIPAPAKSKVAELKRHLNTLEKSSADAPKATASKNTWSKEVAAIDKILTELLGPASGSTASEPTGTTGATGAKGSQSRSTTAMTLDETTKSKLMEVRTHVTAYAAAMSGTSGPSASAASAEPAATEPSAAAAAQPPASAAQPSEPTPRSSQPTTSPSTASSPAGQQPTQSPAGAEQAQQPTAAAGQQADPETSKRHLTAARESLSQLTQLPAAAQLSGEPRTQVSQLISNFNELITTKENWRESYNKVEANVTALIGAETSGETAQAPPAQTGGAVGTTGTTSAALDPAIRAKLVEFRTHLKQFEQAAGVADQASAPSSTPGADTSPSASSTAGSTTSQPMAQSSTGATGTTGTTGTTGQQSASATGQDDAVRHIEAIEAILSGRSASSSATTGNTPAGTTGTTTGNVTLNQSQVEEIRMHLAELRKAVDKK